MPFGIKLAQEIFQKRMTQNFGDLEGVETDIDDILIWGKTEEHCKTESSTPKVSGIYISL